MRKIILCAIIFSLQSEAKVDVSEIEKLAKEKTPVAAVKKIATFWGEDPSDPKAIEAVKKTSNEIFNTFYSEQALNHFEVARHLLFKDPAEAQAALEKAQELEPMNGKIFLLWSRAQITQKKCAKALDKAKEMAGYYPFISEVNLLIGQSLACLEKSEDLRTWLDKNTKSEPTLSKYISHLWVQYSSLVKDVSEQKKWLEALKKQDGEFPEINFWDWKMINEDGPEKDAAAKKYLNQCGKMSDIDRRKYLLEPITCHAVKEVKEKQKSV